MYFLFGYLYIQLLQSLTTPSLSTAILIIMKQQHEYKNHRNNHYVSTYSIHGVICFLIQSPDSKQRECNNRKKYYLPINNPHHNKTSRYHKRLFLLNQIMEEHLQIKMLGAVCIPPSLLKNYTSNTFLRKLSLKYTLWN